MITMATYPGQFIEEAAAKAVALRAKHGEDVTFSFNDVDLVAAEGVTAGDLVAEYFAGLKRRSDAYWTPERLAEKARKEEADRAALARVMVALDGVNLADARAAIRWLCDLERHCFAYAPAPTADILARFAAAGYEPGMNLREEGEDKGRWHERVGEDGAMVWLIGQALDGIRSVGAPHQIIHSFAERWGIAAILDEKEPA